MNYTAPCLILCFFSLLFSCQAQPSKNRGYIVQVGDHLENIEFQLTDGTTTSLEKLKGRVVILQFTASWCSVCRKEMPHLEKEVWQAYKDQGLMLIGVDLDEPLEKVKQFGEKMKVTYPLALDPGGKIFYQIAAEGAGVTRNVVLDKNGKIIFLTRLFDKAEFEEMKQVVAAALIQPK